jgi:putative ABC transport system permease protein
MLLIFSVASLILSAVLVATMLNAALVRQVGEIGVMKAIGGRTEQILAIYRTTTTLIAVLATALALGPSVVLGRLLSRAMAGLLNVDLASTAIPWWVFVVQVAAGILIPLVIAFVPLQRGSSVTVRAAIDESGFTGARSRAPRFDALLAHLGGTNRSLFMSLRNAFRRRGRLALAVTLLAAAGTMFLAAVNSAVGWTQMVNDGLAHRHYDIEIKLDRPARATKVTQLVAQVKGVSEVEAWASKGVAAYRAGEIDVERTYPDRAHGGFAITAIPPSSGLLMLPVLKGRWLRADDTNAVVLNQLVVPLQLRDAQIGSEIILSVDGRPTRWHVVGMVSDFGTPATAYVTPRGFAKVDPTPGGADLIRVVTARHDGATQLAVLQEIETKLASAGVPVRIAVPVWQLKAGLDGHVMVLVDLLLALALVMALVGLLGLASTLSASVIERTREFGIMRSIGATPAAIRGMVVAEGIVITAISIVLSIFLSVPLTSLLGSFIGNLAFRLPLPFESSFAAISIWAVAITAGATAAAAIPGRAAARLTIRESLAHT